MGSGAGAVLQQPARVRRQGDDDRGAIGQSVACTCDGVLCSESVAVDSDTAAVMQRSGSQSEGLGGTGAGVTFIAKSSASEHSMSTGVAAGSGGTLPRTLSTSVLRIKNRSTFWEKFWDERTRRDA